MRTDDGRIDHLQGSIGHSASSERFQDHVPDAAVGPSPKLPKDRIPVAEFLRQVAPRCAGSHQPKHRVEHAAMVPWRPAAPMDQERFEIRPLFVGHQSANQGRPPQRAALNQFAIPASRGLSTQPRYGHALLKRTLIVFDELKQSIKDIEYLADPTLGEVRIACTIAATATILPQVVQRFAQQHPRAVVHQDDVTIFAANLSGLRERKYDLSLTRLDRPLTDDDDDLNVEILFNDWMVLAAGMHTRWARRRKIDLAELADEPWILSAPYTWNYARVTEAFQERGLPMPRASAVIQSALLRAHLLANGPYIASLAHSSMRLHTDRYAIKVLPVDLPDRTTPVGIITLKNRTLSPVVERFIEYVRDFTRPMRERRPAPKR